MNDSIVYGFIKLIAWIVLGGFALLILIGAVETVRRICAWLAELWRERRKRP